MFRAKYYYNGDLFPALAGLFVCSPLFERYEQADNHLMTVMHDMPNNGAITGAQIEVQMPSNNWSVACEPDNYESDYCTRCDTYAYAKDTCMCGALQGLPSAEEKTEPVYNGPDPYV